MIREGTGGEVGRVEPIDRSVASARGGGPNPGSFPVPSSSSESLCYSGAIAVRLLLALLLITGLARAQELHLRWSEDPVGQPVWHRMELLPEVPAGFGAPTEAKAPRFAVSFLGGKRVYLAVDGDRLWLDRTFLGKLDQAKPFKAEPVGDRLRTEALFPIKLCAGEAEREVPLEIEWSGDELRCRMLLWRRGHALIDGRSVSEYDRNGKAAREIERLWKTLSEGMGL